MYLTLLLNWHGVVGQSKYQITTIAFYNVENLFDIENDSLTFDDDRTPGGKDRWTQKRYDIKIDRIAYVISKIGVAYRKAAPDIIGLCEIENRVVLEDLVRHPQLLPINYGILHFDSPDERGIDVALLYKKNLFTPISFKSNRLLLRNNENFRDYTRDQLIVNGILGTDEVFLIVNHWPSRSGGEMRSAPNRILAAQLNKKIIDSIQQIDANARIIGMGDFNDNPTNKSFKTVLRTQGIKDSIRKNELYNPMDYIYKRGGGTLAYRDRWNLFDQIYFTSNLLHSSPHALKFWKAGIYNPPYLITKSGRYKGYPLRTYAGGVYIGGFSDHFPVFIYLIKAVE
jgi:hypothetical protein